MPQWIIYFKITRPSDDCEDRREPEQCSIVEGENKIEVEKKLRKELYVPGEYLEIIEIHQVKNNGR